MALQFEAVKLPHDSAEVAGNLTKGLKYFPAFLLRRAHLEVVDSVVAELVDEEYFEEGFLVFFLKDDPHLVKDSPVVRPYPFISEILLHIFTKVIPEGQFPNDPRNTSIKCP